MTKQQSTIHTGDLTITRQNAAQYSHLTEVTGSLDIRSDAKLEALTSVGGYLYISSDCKLEAPALTSVGGSLDIRSDAKLEAPALTSVGGSLDIWSDAKLEAPALTSVGGSLYIRSDAKLEALTSVGGLSIENGARLEAPNLATVAGHALPDAETAAKRIKEVAEAALITPKALDMGNWHNRCGTSHCIAGWAIHQAGPDGYKLEGEVQPASAGAILLGLDAAHMFFTSTDTAREWLKQKAAA